MTIKSRIESATQFIPTWEPFTKFRDRLRLPFFKGFRNEHFKKIHVLICAGVVLVIPLYKIVMFLKESYRRHVEEELFKQRHNCVVRYSPDGGMIGWDNIIFPRTLSNYEKYAEPLVYFINTAELYIDIAVMSLNITPVLAAIRQKLKEGVRVRIIVDYFMMAENVEIYRLKRDGAQVLYYICTKGESIMHYKYAIKDFHKGQGYLVIGSMNWTTGSTTGNYDDLIFLTVPKVVSRFQTCFDQTWDLILKLYDENNVRHMITNMESNLRACI